MSGFADRLRAGEPAITLEITPPKKRLDDVLLRRARLLGGRADAVNVIHREDRLSSLDASLVLLEAGLEPIWHVVNRGRTRAEVESEIASAAAGGLRAALCMRGDYRATDAPDAPKVREVVGMVRDAIPGALLGATVNPYVRVDRALANLLPKLRAGATFVQTSAVFDVETLRPIVEETRAKVPDARFVPIVMPLVSLATAERIRQRLDLPIPRELIARLESGGESAGWRHFTETAVELVSSGLAGGLAVMTPEMDAPDHFAERLASALEALPR